MYRDLEVYHPRIRILARWTVSSNSLRITTRICCIAMLPCPSSPEGARRETEIGMRGHLPFADWCPLAPRLSEITL